MGGRIFSPSPIGGDKGLWVEINVVPQVTNSGRGGRGMNVVSQLLWGWGGGGDKCLWVGINWGGGGCCSPTPMGGGGGDKCSLVRMNVAPTGKKIRQGGGGGVEEGGTNIPWCQAC